MISLPLSILLVVIITNTHQCFSDNVVNVGYYSANRLTWLTDVSHVSYVFYLITHFFVNTFSKIEDLIYLEMCDLIRT